MHTHTPELRVPVNRTTLAFYVRRLFDRLPRWMRPGRDTSGTPAGTFRYGRTLAQHRKLLRGLHGCLAMVRSMAPDRPVCMYVNLLPTHGPYLFEAEDADATRPQGLGGQRLAPRNYLPRMMLDFLGVQPMDERTLAELHWAYAAAARYACRLAGRIVQIIDRHLDPANTDLAIFSDHGELLGEHGFWEHGTFLHGELVRVPLVVRSPVLPAGARSDALVQTHWLWAMARERAGLGELDDEVVGQGSLADAAHGDGADVAWSLSDATADMSLMRRAMMVVMRYGLGAERVRPKPVDPHLQAVRTKDAALLVTKSGRRLACRRNVDGSEEALGGPDAEAVVETLAGHMVEMPSEPAGRQRASGADSSSERDVMARLRDLGYAD
jgi:hypothetical protein